MIINDKEQIIANTSDSPPFTKNNNIEINIPRNKNLIILNISSFLIILAKENIINIDRKATKLSPPLPQKLRKMFFENNVDKEIKTNNTKLIMWILLYVIFWGLNICNNKREKANIIKYAVLKPNTENTGNNEIKK